MFEELHFWILEQMLICGTRSHLCTKMLNRRHLSVRDMERILGMLQAGATQRYAAAQFGVTQSVIQRIWQRFLDIGSVENDQKVVVQERRQRWMTGILSPCLDVRGLTRQEL